MILSYVKLTFCLAVIALEIILLVTKSKKAEDRLSIALVVLFEIMLIYLLGTSFYEVIIS